MRFLNWLETFAICVVGLAIVVVVTLEVLSRFALSSYVSLAWTDEVARGLMTWLTFIGASMLERGRDHIRVTIVTDALSARGRAMADICADLLTVIYLAIVLASSFETLRADFDSTMVSLPVPLIFVSVSLSLGCVGLLIRILARMARETRTILAR